MTKHFDATTNHASYCIVHQLCVLLYTFIEEALYGCIFVYTVFSREQGRGVTIFGDFSIDESRFGRFHGDAIVVKV